MKLIAISFTLTAALAGVASAQAPAKGAPAVPAAPAEKKAPPAATPAAPAAVAPKPPTAPQELVDFAKGMTGAWRCTGTAEVAGEMKDVKATITHKVDANLNKFWLQSTFVGTAPKMPPFKFTGYTTYDATAKKLWRVSVNGYGGHGVSWGTIADKKVSWEGDAKFREGDVKTRETEELVSPREVKVVGEYSKDGGKTWAKDHEATCKR